jgi:hypothetical protein
MNATDTPESDAKEAEAFMKRHRCDCEACARTSTICPASASSIILEAIHIERRLAAMTRENEALKASKDVIELRVDHAIAERDKARAMLSVAREALADTESWMRQIASKPTTVRDDDPVWRMGLLAATKARNALDQIGKEANE